eukprot:9356576-Pyramimonas_sp.AAC.1
MTGARWLTGHDAHRASAQLRNNHAGECLAERKRVRLGCLDPARACNPGGLDPFPRCPGRFHRLILDQLCGRRTLLARLSIPA